ncbi:MAG TPA: hypothetical protein VF188_04180 [Longimicrobiales bacterium]
MPDEPHRNIEWPHSTRLPVLGVMTTFASNSAAVLDAIHESYGVWRELARDTNVVSPSNAAVRIVLHDRPATSAPALVFDYRVPDPTRFFAMWDGGMGVADTQRLESVAYVTADLVANRAEFVAGVIEPLTLFLLGALNRQPVHAAAVVRGGNGILLTGPSGSGKSTISYAAHRHGYSLLSDEPVYVQMRPTLRVWGRRSQVRLPVEARTHFPELHDLAPTRLPGGKIKMVVNIEDRAQPYADHVGICLLRPGSGGKPALERASPGAVVAELVSGLDPGFDLFADTIGERLAAIAERGAWVLHVGRSPWDVLPLLDEITAELARDR